MRLAERRLRLEALLRACREWWHPQPFREPLPSWIERWPALAAELQVLDDADIARLNDDGNAAALLVRYCRALSELPLLTSLPVRDPVPPAVHGPHWAWEIPGRKRQQIEAFAAAIKPAGRPVVDWCCGKGHLGRLLALEWRLPVTGLERDAALCSAGWALARRAGVDHDFFVADALTVEDWPRAGQHAVALHACGDLHRQLIRRGAERGIARLDVAPCCYYRGIEGDYEPMAPGASLFLSRDDLRLAVTETVTAAPRERRTRDREMAWKLGFDAWRRETTGIGYQNFKPVPEAWMRGSFAEFLARMAQRENLPLSAGHFDAFEQRGWQRQREVMRWSVVRHAFRRALEVWLVLDLAGFLESWGYIADVSVFCERRLTPRNLLLSAERA